jgi:hypothetical protein
VSDAQLGPEEDSELRRLHVLKGFGVVAGSVTSRYEALRRRDRRRRVRAPEEASIASPIAKSPWGDVKPPAPRAAEPAPRAAKSAAPRAAEPAPRVVEPVAPLVAEPAPSRVAEPGSLAGASRVVVPARRRSLFRR